MIQNSLQCGKKVKLLFNKNISTLTNSNRQMAKVNSVAVKSVAQSQAIFI